MKFWIRKLAKPCFVKWIEYQRKKENHFWSNRNFFAFGSQLIYHLFDTILSSFLQLQKILFDVRYVALLRSENLIDEKYFTFVERSRIFLC